MVKGSTDHIAQDGRIVERLAEPNIPALEAIGGTGDTISGMVGALVSAGFDAVPAARIAIRANRTAGLYAAATPATRIWQVIEALPRVFAEHLDEWVRQAGSTKDERKAS